MCTCAPHAGDKRLFIRNDELEAAWELFTPILHEIESKKVRHTHARTHAHAHMRQIPASTDTCAPSTADTQHSGLVPC